VVDYVTQSLPAHLAHAAVNANPFLDIAASACPPMIAVIKSFRPVLCHAIPNLSWKTKKPAPSTATAIHGTGSKAQALGILTMDSFLQSLQ